MFFLINNHITDDIVVATDTVATAGAADDHNDVGDVFSRYCCCSTFFCLSFRFALVASE